MRTTSRHSLTGPAPRRSRAALLLILLLGPPLSAIAAEDAIALQALLDGRHFAGQTGAAEAAADHDDVLHFEAGRFTSHTCREYGFAPAPYRVTRDGDDLLFHAITLSPDHGRMEWRGRISGARAEASYSWDHRRWFWQIHREYWFRGRERP